MEKSKHFLLFSIIRARPTVLTTKPKRLVRKMNQPGRVDKLRRAGLKIKARVRGRVDNGEIISWSRIRVK